jgi:hypothetical protein
MFVFGMCVLCVPAYACSRTSVYLSLCVRVCVCAHLQADEELSLPVYARDKQARKGGGGERR